MGKILIIPSADFSAVSIGQITPSQPVELEGLTINGASSVYDATNKTTYSVSYTPTNTSQKGVSWSVSNGSSYATINASTGELTILSGAVGASVTIVATSTKNSSISASKTISVTYNARPANALHYMSMLTNSTDEIGTLTPAKESGTTYNNGVTFDTTASSSSPSGIAYTFDYNVNRCTVLEFELSEYPTETSRMVASYGENNDSAVYGGLWIKSDGSYSVQHDNTESVSSPISLGKHRLAMQMKGSTGVNVFLDGVKINSGGSGTPKYVNIGNGNDLGGLTGKNRCFNGKIRNVAMYSTILTDEELCNLTAL